MYIAVLRFSLRQGMCSNLVLGKFLYFSAFNLNFSKEKAWRRVEHRASPCKRKEPTGISVMILRKISIDLFLTVKMVLLLETFSRSTFD